LISTSYAQRKSLLDRNVELRDVIGVEYADVIGVEYADVIGVEYADVKDEDDAFGEFIGVSVKTDTFSLSA
jgi:hypothetical protein